MLHLFSKPSNNNIKKPFWMLFLLPFQFLPWNLSAVKLGFGFIPNLWIFLCPSSLICLSSPVLFQNNFQWMNILETVFPCVGLTNPAHLSLNKIILVFFTSRMVLFNCQELDCWLGWSPTICRCSYKHWLGWQVLTAESARNLEIHHLGLFVGDNESQLPQTFILFFSKV